MKYNKKIKDLPDTFYVLSHNKNTNENEIKKARKVFSGMKKCYKITFEDNTIVIATKKHRFFTSENEKMKKIRVSNMKKGTILARITTFFHNFSIIFIIFLYLTIIYLQLLYHNQLAIT